MQITQRPYKINFSGNGVYYQLFSEDALTDNSVVFEVGLWFKRSDENVFRHLVTIPLRPDQNGYAVVNWQTVLHAELVYGIPDIRSSIAGTCRTQTGAFYMQYRQNSNTSIDAAWSLEEQDNLKYVVKGGVPEFRFNNNAFWESYFPNQKPFLTHRMDKSLVGFNEIIFIAWLHSFTLNSTSFKVEITVYFSDKSSQSKNLYFNSSPGQIQYIPGGCEMLSLELLAGQRKIWYWNMQIFDNTVVSSPVAVSQSISYILDNRADLNDTQIFYRGSLGGFDTVRVRGVIEQAVDYEVQEFNQPVDPYYENKSVQSSQSSLPASEVMTWKGDVGYLKKEEQDRLRDIFLFRECYMLIRQQLIPINLTTKSFRQRASTDKRWSQPLDWKLANQGDMYYLPSNVDIGEGGKPECDCYIREFGFNRAWENDNKICKVTWALIVACKDGGHQYKMQYKILDVTDWIEIADYNDAMSPVTTHAAGLANVYVLWRVVCPDGGVGPEKIASLDTIKDFEDGEPNSRIENSSNRTLYIGLSCNNRGIPVEASRPGEFGLFYVPPGINTIVVSLTLLRSQRVVLTSSGTPYVPELTQVRSNYIYTFKDVHVNQGVQIVIS